MSQPASSFTSFGSKSATAVAKFLAWWQGELATFIPSRVRSWWQGSARTVTLRFEGGRAVFGSYSEGMFRELFHAELESGTKEDCRIEIINKIGRQIGKDSRIVLTLPDNMVLTRNIKLPMAVEENLRQAVGFELDRFTPFKPEQAYFDVRITDRDQIRHQIEVRLFVAKRASVDPLIVQAQELGLSIYAATPAASGATEGSESAIDLLHDSVRSPVNSGQLRWWRISMASLAVTLMAGFLIIPVWQKRSAAIALLSPLAEAKLAAHETDVLRDKLKGLVEEHNRLFDKKWGTPSALLILEDLSRRLGDDTFLNEFSFDGKSAIHIQGESASAPSLVEGIENSPMFREVGFKSQLTKVSGTSVDRFHIAAALENDARPKPTAAHEAAQASSDPSAPASLRSDIPSAVVVPDTTARTVTPSSFLRR